MKVYHGSYLAIENIDFSFCRKERDFGKGFYVTKYPEHAQQWAERKSSRKNMAAVVTEFEFDEDFFEDEFLKALRFDDYNGEWLDFVVMNRKNRKGKPAHHYDIVEGPIADDDITRRVNKYLRKEITKEQFLIDLTHKPSHQICFCTLQSLQALKLDDEKHKTDIKMMDIDNEIIKSLMKEYGMTDLEAADMYYTSKTFIKLTDETTELYKKPWTEIYEMLKTDSLKK
jgi:hypothetical protein